MRGLLLVFLSACVWACVWETDLPAEARAIPIEPARELVITDVDSIAEPLSFRHSLGTLGSDLDADAFHLIAVANRCDLSAEPDRVAEGGEGRLVYAMKDAPVTAIFEYAQEGSARDWASRWHAVRSPADLVPLAARFGPLARVRITDARSGALVFRQLTPANDALVETRELPANARGETCASCHAKTETGFQIDPKDRRLSRFLSDPNGPADELRRREAWMQLALSGASLSASLP